MKDHFIFAQAIRNKIVKLIDEFSIERLNKIPDGFRNNIAWHIGHLVVSGDILCYHRSGIQPERSILFSEDYRNGTVPKEWIGREEIQYFRQQLTSSLANIEEDYHRGVFQEVQPFTTITFGAMLQNIEDVFGCVSHHDLLHFGHIQAMTKLV